MGRIKEGLLKSKSIKGMMKQEFSENELLHAAWLVGLYFVIKM